MFPVKDCGGNVLNLCGYTYGSDVKYLYGTAKYYDRRDDLYGLENWYIAIQAGWAVIVEGITDCVAILFLTIQHMYLCTQIRFSLVLLCYTYFLSHLCIRLCLYFHCKY